MASERGGEERELFYVVMKATGQNVGERCVKD